MCAVSLLPSSSLGSILDSWKESASGNQRDYYQRASKKIADFEEDRDTDSLNLKYAGLDKLPEDLFLISLFSRDLKVLNLSNNYLQDLSNVQYLTALEVLDLSYNRFSRLPSGIENLPALKTLHLNHNNIEVLSFRSGCLTTLEDLLLLGNQLKTFPSGIEGLTRLIRLNLDNNELKTLSSDLSSLRSLTFLILSTNDLTALPSEIGSCTALKVLRIGFNHLSTLPSTMSSLTNLTDLNYHHNQLTVVPREVGSLVSLENLSLSDNFLTTVPPAICSLTALKYLYLDDNPLRALPPEIKCLPRSCDISLERHAFPKSVIQQIDRCHSIHCGKTRSSFDREHAIENFLRNLAIFAQIRRRHRIDPEQLYKQDSEFKVRLHSWLFNLFQYANFGDKDERGIKLAQRMSDLLELASADPQFLAIFRSVVIASVKAGSGIALSLLDVEVQYQLAIFDKRDLPGLSRLLARGVFATEILKTIVQEKGESLPFVDKTDLYFGYHSQLWEQLELLEIEDMGYLAYTELTEEELDAAVERVESALKNDGTLHAFLIEQETWLQALKIADPERFEAIESGLKTQTERAALLIEWSKNLLKKSEK